MNTIAVFKSRTQALSVYRYLQSKKIACMTINTPSKLRLGCGISILLPDAYVGEVKNAVRELSANTFVGFFHK